MTNIWNIRSFLLVYVRLETHQKEKTFGAMSSNSN